METFADEVILDKYSHSFDELKKRRIQIYMPIEKEIEDFKMLRYLYINGLQKM
ncbi:hypothetical protein [Neobacillus sp. BF23-41]|uniref:hypothetical protein n=1 Tax=Neobacillus sp. BF23-41 TaxID=3240280 RepID=UPI0034E41707